MVTAMKEKTPQADVRIVGGKTTVSLRAFGLKTLDRMGDLVGELNQNARTSEAIHAANAEVSAAMTKLMALINAEA